MAISCQLCGDIDDLSEGGADAAYRMVQEGITNVMKHRGVPTEVTVCGGDDGLPESKLNSCTL